MQQQRITSHIGQSSSSTIPVILVGLLLLSASSNGLHAQSADEASGTPPEASAVEEHPQPADDAATSKASSAPVVVIPPAPTPLILDPYRVRVRLSCPVAPNFSLQQSQDFSQEVKKLLSARFRQHWNLDLATAESEERETQQSLQLADSEAWTARWQPLDEEQEGTHAPTFDKVFHVVIEQQGALLFVTAVEWCSSSQTLSPLVNLQTADRRDLAATVANAIARAFRPLAEIEVGEGDKLEFQVRAGELPPADPALVPFQEGQYIVPYLRYLGKKRTVQRIQMLPWTFLKVVERDRSRFRCETVSAFRQPIPQSRRRVEVMAMWQHPNWSESEIRIYPRGGINTPLVGYRCDVVDRLPTLEDPVPERDEYYTNRQGKLSVPASEGDPLRYLLVHSGQSILARVPLIPGLTPHLELEVPSDRARLGVEGEVSLLQGELIDIIATREVLMARARGAARKQDWDAVANFTEEIVALPTRDQFKGRVEALQLQAVYQARDARDRAAESRIKQLCGGLLESAETHLDPGRIAEFRGEMKAMRP